jgi:hypothetical protein
VEDRLCQGLKHLINHPEIVASITKYPWMNTICLMSN